MTYTELVDLVHSYTTRDSKVLPYNLVKTFIDFTNDRIYNKLRIPPLEKLLSYNDITVESERLPVPDDLIEFIQLRKLDDNGDVDRVYNAKADVRSFNLGSVTKYDRYHYSREVNELLIHPKMEVGDKMELLYYRRLPAAYSRYSVDQANYDSGIVYYSASSSNDLTAKSHNSGKSFRSLVN